jgi:hypothetical protein
VAHITLHHGAGHASALHFRAYTSALPAVYPERLSWPGAAAIIWVERC